MSPLVPPLETASIAALAQRLSAVADVLLTTVPVTGADPAETAATLLPQLVDQVRSASDPAAMWLLYTGLAGSFPTAEQVREAGRTLDLALDGTDAELGLLRIIGAPRRADLELDVVRDGVLVDVDFSASNDKNTGIQRVTREVCARWTAQHAVTLVAWDRERTAYRRLNEVETRRVAQWVDTPLAAPSPRTGRAPEPTHERLVVPWRSTVVMTEVPPAMALPRLAALAELSGNEVVAIGYDAIPVTHADLRPLNDATAFVRYLTVLKHARRIAGISISAAAEFRGFSEALQAQGLRGAQVHEVMLATELATGPGTAAGPAPRERHRILCVGSHELHKNHLAVVHAAERLWREGLDFELVFIGAPGWSMDSFNRALERLREAGRPFVDLGRVTDREMWRHCREADFTIFPSLHEGFGLPVSESLTCGTPVITTGYGSTREIAEQGGCLLVDPRDDDEIADAMRRLLTEPDVLAALTEQARAYRVRTWDEYADVLWSTLVVTDLTGSNGA